MSEARVYRTPYSDGAAFIDGRFVPVAEARVPILDWGFLRSDATYDVAHVWRGGFFRLEDHLSRFEGGMEWLRMKVPYGRAEIQEILTDCVRLSGLHEAYVEVVCTRGVPPPGSRDPRECENRLYAFAVPFVWIADPEKQEQGLDAVIGRVQRIQPEAVDPTVKNYHWLDLVAGLFEAYDRGGETVILT
ncbi:MAG: aminotransferase class IV, partial [Rubrobacteraceae bacterium]